MENHPIPQDITGFQFKLIGDMTIKQFAYLATGSVLGWIIFSLPIVSLIKLPLAGLFVFLGIAFAFFSVAGRPIDVMIVNFFKATFSPSQYVYEKVGGSLPYPRMLPSLHHQAPKSKLDQKEFIFFKNLHFPQLHPFQHEERPPTPQILTAHPLPNLKAEKKEKKAQPKLEELSEEAQVLEKELQKARVEEQILIDSSPKADQPGTEKLYEDAHQKVLEIERLLNETLLQKQSLENQLLSLKKQLEESKKQVFTPGQATDVLKESQTVRSISKSMGKSAGIPVAPEFPNIISGIVKDPRGNPLPNILVEVKDKDGNPVRAFKTNPLGQFTASTPLVNGTYRIEFEDPRGENKFDIIEFGAQGDVILPIEVISQDLREELRKSLFKS